MKKELLILSTILLLSITLVSAGLFDGWSITGKATSQTTNVSVGVTGASPAQITYVSPIAATNPTEISTTDIVFYATMYDADGVNDLDDTSVSARFTKGGETTREDTSCSIIGDIDGNSANYTCTITMQYYDGSGTWNINVTGTDLGNLSQAENTSETFTYNQLKAMVIDTASISWGTLSSGATNQEATDDPTTINNTGNYDGTISVTGLNLLGESTPTEMIETGNFTVAGVTPCSGTALVNGSSTSITATDSNPGDLSAGGGQEELYYCIPNVPLVPSQTYSTSQGGAWTISF